MPLKPLSPIIFFFLQVFSLVFISLLNSSAEPNKSSRCGVILPLSASNAEWGAWIRNGIELFAAEAPNQSTQFIYEDDQFNPKLTVSAFHKLRNEDKVDCLISFGSSTSLAVQPLAEAARIPLFAIGLNPKIGHGQNYVFRYYIPLSGQVEAFIREIKARGYKRIAMLTSQQDATLALRDSLKNLDLIEIVFDQTIESDQLSLPTMALKVKASTSDAVFLNLIPPMASTFARRLRELDYKGDFFSGPAIESPDEAKAAKGALEGCWFVTLDDSKASTFKSSYENKYHSKPGILAVYGYDIAKMIAQCSTASDISSCVRSIKSIDGAAGHYGWTGSEFDIPVGIWRFKGTEFIAPST